MKLFTTILAGALLTSAGLISMAGCSSDDEPAAGASGAGGSGGSGGASGAGGSSGSSGSSGRGGSSGTSSGDAAVCTTPTAAQITECKMIGATSGSCDALVQCACDNCACELADCQASATCTAIRSCVSRTGCCPTGREAECGTGRPACTTACSAEIAAGQMDNGLTLVLAVNSCVNMMRAGAACPLCPFDGGTTTDAGTGGTGGAADSGGGG